MRLEAEQCRCRRSLVKVHTLRARRRAHIVDSECDDGLGEVIRVLLLLGVHCSGWSGLRGQSWQPRGRGRCGRFHRSAQCCEEETNDGPRPPSARRPTRETSRPPSGGLAIPARARRQPPAARPSSRAARREGKLPTAACSPSSWSQEATARRSTSQVACAALPSVTSQCIAPPG